MKYQEKLEQVREILESKLGTKVYTAKEASRMFAKAGYARNDGCIIKILKESNAEAMIGPEMPANLKSIHARFYLKDLIWEALKNLEKEGQINLEARRVYGIEDLIEKKPIAPEKPKITREKRKIVPAWTDNGSLHTTRY